MARRKGSGSHNRIPRKFIAGNQFRYDWSEQQVHIFIKEYIQARKERYSDSDLIIRLSDHFERSPIEVAILIMDLGERGYIGPEGEGCNPDSFTITDCDIQDEEEM